MSRHRDALGEAHRACQALGSQVDPEKAAPRGRHYADLTKALKALEGTCRQMAHFRGDMRWVRLQFVYVRVMQVKQARFVSQNWAWFGKLTDLFVLGKRRLAELNEQKTGVRGPILAQRPSEFLTLPEPPKLWTPPGTTIH